MEKNKMNVLKKNSGLILLTTFVFMVYFFMYLPVISLLANSCNSSTMASIWEGFTLKWYAQIISSSEVRYAFFNSIFIASCSTVLSVLLGTMLVLGTIKNKKSFLDALFYPNIFTPDIVLALAILNIFKFLEIPCGFVSLIIGHTAIGLIFVIPLIKTKLNELDSCLVEASLDLGANYWYTTKKILLPLLKPAILTASLMTFTLSLDDFFISFFCAGPEIQTLSLYVFSRLRTQSSPSLSALSTIMILISFLALFVSYKIVRKTSRENSPNA